MLEQVVLMQGDNFPPGVKVKTSLGKQISPSLNLMLTDKDKYAHIDPSILGDVANTVMGLEGADLVEFTCQYTDGSQLKISRLFMSDAPEMPCLETVIARGRSASVKGASYCRIDTLAYHNAVKNQVDRKMPNITSTVEFARYVFSRGQTANPTEYFSKLIKVSQGESFTPLIIDSISSFARDMSFGYGMEGVKETFNFYAKGVATDKAMQTCCEVFISSLVKALAEQLSVTRAQVQDAKVSYKSGPSESRGFAANVQKDQYGMLRETVYGSVINNQLYLFVGYESAEDVSDDHNLDVSELKPATLIYLPLTK